MARSQILSIQHDTQSRPNQARQEEPLGLLLNSGSTDGRKYYSIGGKTSLEPLEINIQPSTELPEQQLIHNRTTSKPAVNYTDNKSYVHSHVYTNNYTSRNVNNQESYKLTRNTDRYIQNIRTRLVAWLSGRTSVSGRRTFPVLRSTCS